MRPDADATLSVFEPSTLPSVRRPPDRTTPAKASHDRETVDTARRGAGIFAGFPFAARPSRGTSLRPSSSAQERLTLSRSTIDRKPSPLRPSGFCRSSSYCNHDKHTRRLDELSRTRFEAHRVASLPAEKLSAERTRERTRVQFAAAGGRSTDKSAIHFRGRTIRSVSFYTLRR